jgi:hypothetical protein
MYMQHLFPHKKESQLLQFMQRLFLEQLEEITRSQNDAATLLSEFRVMIANQVLRRLPQSTPHRSALTHYDALAYLSCSLRGSELSPARRMTDDQMLILRATIALRSPLDASILAIRSLPQVLEYVSHATHAAADQVVFLFMEVFQEVAGSLNDPPAIFNLLDELIVNKVDGLGCRRILLVRGTVQGEIRRNG